ncbi:type II toxin-antitoxin system RelE/ParE family toxin [archaeon]|jgi:mRNA-degrading endonuclease RelE of RelBE toxin-antitoxin system|nr:type II toxin-antitoxin system RelE/ParE family toxin [archaeon]MBT4241571.1 type II toxin-antitoxin system RelE/ParE family toxin [archaeon]MBT4417966.1 type II toxin-antitoxin system RelE/ParE family toxin [archaeon]
MRSKVKFSPQAKKFIKKLDKNESLRILDKLNDVREDPFRYLEHFEGEGHKLRIGDYRALIDVNFNTKILIVRVLDKRGRIYK